MSNLYQSFYCTILICCLAVHAQSQSFNLNFNSEFTAIHEMENGHYLLAFNQFTNGSDFFIPPVASTGWIQLDNNLQILDTIYTMEDIDFIVGAGGGERIKQFVKHSNGNLIAIYEFFDCDYFPNDGILSVNETMDFTFSNSNLLDVIPIENGYVGTSFWENNIELLNESYVRQDQIAFDSNVNDLLSIDLNTFAVATEEQIHVLNIQGEIIETYNNGALHLSIKNDTILAISENIIQLFDTGLHLLETKEHEFISDSDQLRFKQIEEKTYIFKQYRQTRILTEISQKGDSIRTVTLPKGTVINDLFKKGDCIYSIGFDAVGQEYDDNIHLLFPSYQSSTTASIKAIDFEKPINTKIDISLNEIRIGDDSNFSNTTCSHPLSSITNMANVHWKDIEVEITNTGEKPITSFMIEGEFKRRCSFFCNGFYAYSQMVNLTENPIEVGASYTYTISSFETPNVIKSLDNEYELCLWVSNVNNEQDMNPDNNYYCGVFPVISSVQQIESAQIEVFPNPSSQYISIQMNEEYSDTKEVYIYDLGGQLIKQTSFAGNRIDLNIEYLFSGTYYLNIQSQKQSYSEKLIVIKD